MTLEAYTYRVWCCSICGFDCGSIDGDVDNFDLLCHGCGRAYVITEGGDVAVPVGA